MNQIKYTLLSRNFFIFLNKNKIFYIFICLSILFGILSKNWVFWLIFDIFLYIILIIYFSKNFKNLLNIHVVALTFLILHSIPSVILILQNKIILNNDERLILFYCFGFALIGYTFGALFFKKLNFFKRNKQKISKKFNYLFWLLYKYRYTLTLISFLILFLRGLMPMSYAESILYRIETPGVIQYINSLFSVVFSPIIITIISIIGDINKRRKLSLLSYLLIALILVSIVSGNRLWIVSLFATLIIAFQPYLKKKNILFILISAFILTFIISGGVRYARSGKSSIENIKNFYDYSLKTQDMSIKSLAWGFSDFTVPFSTFITLIQNIPEKIEFDYYAPIKDFSLLVPKIIYPTRPLPYNEWYVKTFLPEVYKIGGGRTFYVIGLGYLFAGIIGIIIYLFLFGFLFEFFNKFFKRIGDPAGSFLYAYFFTKLFGFVRACGFFAFIKNEVFLYWFLPISVLFLFVLILNSIRLTSKS